MIMMITDSQKTHEGNGNIYVVFRMDDYSALSDTDLELKIIRLFEERELSVTFSVVPYVCEKDDKDPAAQPLIRLSDQKGLILKKKVKSGVLDLALHGYAHQSNNANDPSEFGGLQYHEQLKRLKEGKALLEEIAEVSVTTFVPPWNQYDHNTLKAMKESGFNLLSAGWKGVVTSRTNIQYLPATCDLTLLPKAIDTVRLSSDKYPVIVVLFHHYDFKEYGDPRGQFSLNDLATLLDWLLSQKDLNIISIGQAYRILDDLSPNRFIVLERWRKLERFLPIRFKEKKPILYYHEARVYYRTLVIFCFYYIFIFIISLCSMFLAMSLLLSLMPQISKELVIGGTVATLAMVTYAFKGTDVSPKGFLASVIAVALNIGMVCAFFVRKFMG